MLQHDSIFIAPLPTEVPDYVWCRRYDNPAWLPGRPVRKEKDTSLVIAHPDAESALSAAKKACRKKCRWYGRALGESGVIAFLVYENGKVIERHVVSLKNDSRP